VYRQNHVLFAEITVPHIPIRTGTTPVRSLVVHVLVVVQVLSDASTAAVFTPHVPVEMAYFAPDIVWVQLFYRVHVLVVR